MKKTVSLILSLALCLGVCFSLSACGDTADGGSDSPDYTVGICQLMAHSSLDLATEGFIDALAEAMAQAGKTVSCDVQVAGESDLCTTVVNAFVAKEVDLIMANATPALLAAANATSTIPVLGTSVTDYSDTFGGSIPANVSGTSDAVPFDEQAKMMIESLGLAAGDTVGVIYCTNESNSLLQYNAVKEYFDDAGILVNAYTFSETTELQSLTTKAAGECQAIYVPSDNTVADNDSIVGTICTEAKVPVYTSYGGSICYASLAIDYYELGWETGKMAAEILLNGADPADIEIATLTPSLVYNTDLCQELGIQVPEN